jgi:hypothetical protein
MPMQDHLALPGQWMPAQEAVVVIGWLSRVALTLSVLGVLLFDTSALLVGHVSAADRADAAAQAAADSWRAQHSPAAALLAAQGAAGDDEVVAGSLSITPDGATSLSLHREVSTLVLHRLPRLRELASVTETGRGRPPLS